MYTLRTSQRRVCHVTGTKAEARRVARNARLLRNKTGANRTTERKLMQFLRPTSVLFMLLVEYTHVMYISALRFFEQYPKVEIFKFKFLNFDIFPGLQGWLPCPLWRDWRASGACNDTYVMLHHLKHRNEIKYNEWRNRHCVFWAKFEFL